VLRTRYGNVFHSGDWKLDPDPKVGPISDETKIKKYVDEGVLAYIGDSTNAFSPGSTGSEGELRESLREIISACEQMVMVTTFASNVARIDSIAKIAEECGRKVVLAGRSLWRIVHAAQAAGYLKDCPEFYEDDALSRFSRDQLLILCT
jgi:ribonuclease J